MQKASLTCVCVCVCVYKLSLQSCLFTTLWMVAHQALLSMGFSSQEYQSGFPCPAPREFPDLGIEPSSLMSPTLEGGFFTTSTTWEALLDHTNFQKSFLPLSLSIMDSSSHHNYPGTFQQSRCQHPLLDLGLGSQGESETHF